MAPPFHRGKFNYWDGKTPASGVVTDCLLPNGLSIPIESSAGISIRHLRDLLWKAASEYPLFELLKEKEKYSFTAVRKNGLQEELVDDEQSLFDVQPFRPYLKVAEKLGDDAEKALNLKISLLIGRSVRNFDHLKSPEVDDFRRKYRSITTTIARERGQSSWERRAVYTFPAQFAETASIPDSLHAKYPDGVISVAVHIDDKLADILGNTFHKTIACRMQEQPSVLVDRVLLLADVDLRDDYVLKLVGRMTYLLPTVEETDEGETLVEHPLHFYKCIRDLLVRDLEVHVSIVAKCDLDVVKIVRGLPLKNDALPPLPPKAGKNTISLWDIEPTTCFKLKVVCALNVFAGDMKKSVRCGIYHGGESLCNIERTVSNRGDDIYWKTFLEFELAICDIPRMACLCFCIYGSPVTKKGKSEGKQKEIPLYWVNTSVFDYKGFLKTGSHQLFCWPCGPRMCVNDQLHPLGTVVPNSNTDGCCLVVEFPSFAEPVVCPKDAAILGLASNTMGKRPGPHPFLTSHSKEHVKYLNEILARDPLFPLFEQDKELIWRLRDECYQNPSSLPKLLRSVKWNCKEDVAQMHSMLQSWRKDLVQPEEALELLDYMYPDIKVRAFAVDVIGRFSDTELEQYLLQLVQALKYELYLDSPLAAFLLRKALSNRRIGHFLFWHLRAEMSNSDVALKFGLLLEAYCIGSEEHLTILGKQQHAVNKIKSIVECVEANHSKDKDANDLMKDLLLNCGTIFSDLVSPLDPSVHLKQPICDKCKFMTSKKKPLKLVFENGDPLGGNVSFIFKNGDDLRQDMLTLQILKIMDNIWSSEGLNLKLIPYGCLATANNQGFIEWVNEAQTVSSIQLEQGAVTGVLRESTLYNWLQKVKKTEEDFPQMIADFTASCAGYCVATYILGIADRHNGNIMMKKTTGQLFHIDFGHFLGNFKYKWRVKRERVPFVLTQDFIYVITLGASSTSEEFAKFRNLCLSAFEIIRRKGSLFITLFAMMLSTGMPELQEAQDLDYLRNSLSLTKSDEEAYLQFNETFQEAYDNKWTTSLNWITHNIKYKFESRKTSVAGPAVMYDAGTSV